MKLIQNSISQLLNDYKIVLIVASFILGILLNEYLDYPWILVAITGFIGIVILIFFRSFSFLLFIPLGLVFSANSQLISDNNVLDYTNKKIDLEGVLYRSPESREEGSTLYLDTNYVALEGVKEPASGKVIIYSDNNTKSLAYGDRVRLLGIKLRPIESFKNPGGFNLKRFYERQSIYARGFVNGDEQIISFGLDESYSPILHYIDSLRIKYGNFARENFQSPQSEILNAITVGEKRGIPQEVRTEFSKAGVAHVLAISGLHVGAVAVAFFFLIKWLLKRSEYVLLKYQVPRLASAMTILPIFLYAAVAGFSTSTVRAFIMISLYLLSIVIGKEEYRLNTLCAAALIILLWHPWSLFELSFQLSFSAVFAILLAHKFYPFKFRTLEDKFYSLVKTTIAATLITFPLIANSFGILPLASIPANLIIVPLVEFIIVPVSLISFIGFLFSPHIAEPLMSLNIFFIEMLVFGVEMFLKIPYSSLTVPPMNTFSWVLFFMLILCLIANSAYTKFKYVIPFIVIGFIATLIYPLPGKSIDGELAINYMDVGKNKSVVLIELPDDKNILIDGGYSKSDGGGYIDKTVVSNYLLNKGIRKIDLLILSSIDQDHLNGAVHLTDKFNTTKILTNGEKLIGALWENINEKEIKWVSLSKADKTIYLGDAKLNILVPPKDFVIEDTRLPYPVAIKLTYGNSSFLFGESLNQATVQRGLLDSSKGNIKSKVLYMANINTESLIPEFIESVWPKIVVTNVKSDLLSRNTTGLNQETLILSTENVGAITVTSDGGKLKVKSFVDEKELILH